MLDVLCLCCNCLDSCFIFINLCAFTCIYFCSAFTCFHRACLCSPPLSGFSVLLRALLDSFTVSSCTTFVHSFIFYRLCAAFAWAFIYPSDYAFVRWGYLLWGSALVVDGVCLSNHWDVARDTCFLYSVLFEPLALQRLRLL
jgi:hypothetical protein